MSQVLHRVLPIETKLTRPSGGFVLWVQLPESLDSLVLYRHALRAGIAITPGYLFSATDQYRNFIRLTAANWSTEVEAAIEGLGELIARLA